MPNYKKLYFKLFGAMADALEIIDTAMKEAEEEYLNSCEEDEKNKVELKLIRNEKENRVD